MQDLELYVRVCIYNVYICMLVYVYIMDCEHRGHLGMVRLDFTVVSTCDSNGNPGGCLETLPGTQGLDLFEDPRVGKLSL